MKKYIYIIAFAVIILTAFAFQHHRINVLKADKARYKANMEVLMSDVHNYKVRDSLNIISTNSLTLKIDELKKLRADDYALIKDLKIAKKELEGITDLQQRTIIELQGSVHDSIVYIDNYRTDTLRCIDIINKWYKFQGIYNNKDEFNGSFVCYDSLKIVESVKYKRFLGFLWRTNKVKSRHIDVISLNPYTIIEGIEHICIEK